MSLTASAMVEASGTVTERARASLISLAVVQDKYPLTQEAEIRTLT